MEEHEETEIQRIVKRNREVLCHLKAAMPEATLAIDTVLLFDLVHDLDLLNFYEREALVFVTSLPEDITKEVATAIHQCVTNSADFARLRINSIEPTTETFH